MFSPKEMLFYVTLLPVIAIFGGLVIHIVGSLTHESPAKYQEIPEKGQKRR